MTGRELLKALREELAEIGGLDEDVDVLGVLDCLAAAGLPGARDVYLAVLERSAAAPRIQSLPDGTRSDRPES